MVKVVNEYGASTAFVTKTVEVLPVGVEDDDVEVIVENEVIEMLEKEEGEGSPSVIVVVKVPLAVTVFHVVMEFIIKTPVAAGLVTVSTFVTVMVTCVVEATVLMQARLTHAQSVAVTSAARASSVRFALVFQKVVPPLRL